MVGKSKPPTKAEKERMDAIKQMKCICCEMDEHTQPNPTEVDHSVANGYRKHSGGHSATIPLCGWHHSGTRYSSEAIGTIQEERMLELWGPSQRLHHRRFREKYGSDAELLARVNKKLGVT